MTLNPIFNVHAKSVLKEVMRHLEVSTLLYRDDRSSTSPDPQTCVMENVLQIKPRQFVFSTKDHDRPTYGLYAIHRRHVSVLREQINHRIVVIGSSDDCDSCYGFLE